MFLPGVAPPFPVVLVVVLVQDISWLGLFLSDVPFLRVNFFVLGSNVIPPQSVNNDINH